jgi:hypothetical protein
MAMKKKLVNSCMIDKLSLSINVWQESELGDPIINIPFTANNFKGSQYYTEKDSAKYYIHTLKIPLHSSLYIDNTVFIQFQPAIKLSKSACWMRMEFNPGKFTHYNWKQLKSICGLLLDLPEDIAWKIIVQSAFISKMEIAVDLLGYNEFDLIALKPKVQFYNSCKSIIFNKESNPPFPTTLYIGSKYSNSFLKIYNKSAELYNKKQINAFSQIQEISTSDQLYRVEVTQRNLKMYINQINELTSPFENYIIVDYSLAKKANTGQKWNSFISAIRYGGSSVKKVLYNLSDSTRKRYYGILKECMKDGINFNEAWHQNCEDLRNRLVQGTPFFNDPNIETLPKHFVINQKQGVVDLKKIVLKKCYK